MTPKTKVKERVVSKGIRKRLGREVMDATESVQMPLTALDIKTAQNKRRLYDVDDPDNFGECVLATCVSKIAGAEVLIFRNHAYIALPDEEYTRRYEVAPESMEIIRLNDEERFDEIPPNVTLKLLVPRRSTRLVTMRNRAKAKNHYKASRGARPQRGPADPYKGVFRNGVKSTDDD